MRTTNKKEPNENKRFTFWTRLRNCPHEGELVLATQTREGNIRNSNTQAELKQEIHQVRIGWWMKHIQNMWIDHFVVLIFLCMIEASKVEHSSLQATQSVAGGCWLLAAVFVSAASIPHLGAFEAVGTLSE